MKRGNNFKDISGKKFGMLTAIECVGSNADNKALWKCCCDCGGECIATGKSLRSGEKTNCGCIKGHSVDLIGQRFGNLTVIERDLSTTDKYHSVYWKCRCDCGNTKIVKTANLRNGSTVSCGCIRKNDLTGKRFDRLTVLEKCPVEYTKSGNRVFKWRCRCDCGNVVNVVHSNLVKGVTGSCGCMQKELASERFSTHGMRNTRLYGIYANMKQRCENPNNPRYESYGGRDITICPEWLGENGFENFCKWSMQNGYADNLTLDRENNDKGYNPSNCRWVTQEVQRNNQRKTIWIEILGIKKSLKQWTDFMGWKYGRYSARHRRNVDIFTKEEIGDIENKIMEVKRNE